MLALVTAAVATMATRVACKAPPLRVDNVVPDVSRPIAAQVVGKRQQQNATVWPYGPFHTSGRDIVNSRGEKITWAGVNWPLSGEAMIPEGLEFASADDILTRAASIGFNLIRM